MLKLLYGNDTRSVRVLNLLVHLMWCYLIVTHLAGWATVDLPEKIEPSFTLILAITITNLVITCLSFSDSIWKIRLKYFSLSLGSLTQLLIGLKYATNYPPFDIMVIVCSLLALWFVGGAIHISHSNKEVINVGTS